MCSLTTQHIHDIQHRHTHTHTFCILSATRKCTQPCSGLIQKTRALCHILKFIAPDFCASVPACLPLAYTVLHELTCVPSDSTPSSTVSNLSNNIPLPPIKTLLIYVPCIWEYLSEKENQWKREKCNWIASCRQRHMDINRDWERKIVKNGEVYFPTADGIRPHTTTECSFDLMIDWCEPAVLVYSPGDKHRPIKVYRKLSALEHCTDSMDGLIKKKALKWTLMERKAWEKENGKVTREIKINWKWTKHTHTQEMEYTSMDRI